MHDTAALRGRGKPLSSVVRIDKIKPQQPKSQKSKSHRKRKSRRSPTKALEVGQATKAAKSTHPERKRNQAKRIFLDIFRKNTLRPKICCSSGLCHSSLSNKTYNTVFLNICPQLPNGCAISTNAGILPSTIISNCNTSLQRTLHALSIK